MPFYDILVYKRVNLFCASWKTPVRIAIRTTCWTKLQLRCVSWWDKSHKSKKTTHGPSRFETFSIYLTSKLWFALVRSWGAATRFRKSGVINILNTKKRKATKSMTKTKVSFGQQGLKEAWEVLSNILLKATSNLQPHNISQPTKTLSKMTERGKLCYSNSLRSF